MNLCCPNCHNSTDTEVSLSQTIIVCPECDAQISLVDLLSQAPASFCDTMKESSHDEEVDQIGETIGHFQLKQILGQGGFGVVYKAHDLELDRDVAVKVPRSLAMTRRQAEIFIREAQAAAQLNHPNIVSVYEIGQAGDQVFIVSELIEGVTLKHWRQLEERTHKQIAAMVAEIAQALHVAHSEGIVHRDIKPGNILVDYLSQPHITDFGLAERNTEQPSLFQSGQAIGTAAYMSPEQRSGDKEAVDHRSDIYSLGIVLYELLTGTRPAQAHNEFTSDHRVDSPREQDATIPAEISAICMKAISQQATSRFQTSAEFADDLTRFSNGLPTKTLPPTKIQLATRAVNRNKSYLMLMGLAFLFGAIIFASIYQSGTDHSDGVGQNNNSLDQATPPNGQVFVDILVTQPTCVLRSVKVNEEGNYIDYSNIVELEQHRTTQEGKVFRACLPTGWHIFEAIAPDGSIAEVWRLVPELSVDAPDAKFRSTHWKRNGRHTVILHPIQILPVDSEKYLECQAGEYRTGAVIAGTLVRIHETDQTIPISKYLISPYEVSLQEYTSVMNSLPNDFPDRDIDIDANANLAMNYVSFLEALEYSERVGGRLPTIEEYQFVATNGYTSNYPWGNQWIFNSWKFGDIGTPPEDRSKIGAFNLYSNLSEWTSDVEMTKVFKEQKSNMGMDESIKTTRVVVGGTHAFAQPIEAMTECNETPQDILVHPTNGMFPNPAGAGFRVYRSLVPRFNPESKTIMHYIQLQKSRRN